MWTINSKLRDPRRLGGLLLVVIVLPWSLAHASRAVEERRSADPKGMVEVVNVAGSVEVIAWDRPEVEVSGSVDDDVERVDVNAAGNRTAINVVLRSGVSRHGGEARLLVHVPAASSVSATLVSSDLKLSGIRGSVRLQTVTGDVSGDIGGDLRASTVSGSLRLTAHDSRRTEIKTINGDLHLIGGGGEVEITTVSGTMKVELGTVTRGRFSSVSGKLTADLTLAPGAQLDGESVSGNVSLNFHAAPDAEFDIQSFSGEIHHCFGPAPAKSRYGPGSRLSFTNGSGQGRVHVDTKSGDVRLCTGDSQDKEAAANSQAPMRLSSANLFYVL